METRTFGLGTVLSVTTKRLLTVNNDPSEGNGIGQLYEILGWMTNDFPYTHQLGRFQQECRHWILRWFPELDAADDMLHLLDSWVSEYGPQEGCRKYLRELRASNPKIKELYAVPRIPKDDHDHKDPYDELVSTRGGDKGIIAISSIDDEVDEDARP